MLLLLLHYIQSVGKEKGRFLMIYTIMLVTWITQHTLPGLPCPCQRDFQKALGNSEINFTKATLQSITLKSRQNHAITEYLLACRQFRVHSVVGMMPLLPDCLQFAIIAESLDKSCYPCQNWLSDWEENLGDACLIFTAIFHHDLLGCKNFFKGGSFSDPQQL
jgi:hypothetical protein